MNDTTHRLKEMVIAVLQPHWDKTTILFRGNEYRVGKMSYGAWFLAPGKYDTDGSFIPAHYPFTPADLWIDDMDVEELRDVLHHVCSMGKCASASMRKPAE